MSRVFALSGLIALLSAGTAFADDCGASYMVLPDGGCVNLDYTTILGKSRGNKASNDQRYQKVFDANVVMDANRDITKETKEEREERLQTLAEYKRINEAVNADAQTVENLLYPVHLRAMGKVYRGFNR